MATRAKYVGDGGEYLEGVPMRDITEDEWKPMSKEERDVIRNSSLYEVDTDDNVRAAVSDEKAKQAKQEKQDAKADQEPAPDVMAVAADADAQAAAEAGKSTAGGSSGGNAGGGS